MELRQLRYFVAAAQEVHFGRAARRLHITQPALGQQIKELERELGVPLFERLPRGVRLTPAGRALLSDAQRLLEDADRTAEHVQRVARGEAGTLRIGHVPLTMLRGTVASHLIPAFCSRYPNVEVETFELTTSDQCAALGDGRIDVAIFYTVGVKDFGFTSHIVDERLLTGALLPAAHPLARKNPLLCADLSALPCLNPPASTSQGVNDSLMDELRARGVDIKAAEYHFSDVAMRVDLVAGGAGWLIADTQAAQIWTPTHRDVVFRECIEPPIHFPCSIFWRCDDQSALVANFVGVARESHDHSSHGVHPSLT
jgi:DNA-binding transcriptional LysR family regulator